MPTFLITGGAGYVGSHTVKALSAHGHQCVTFDDLSTGHRDFLKWGPLHEGDIRDASALEEVFRRYHPDIVIHFAARAYVAASVQDPSAYYDVNVRGTQCLLDAMVRNRVPSIVFSSSCAVYGVPEESPIVEECTTNPINPYGFTKLVCERMLDDYGVAFGLRSIKLRYFNAAGADQELEIGEHHDPEPHLIPLVLDAAAGRQPAVQILGTDYPTRDGSAVRDYVHVADLAAGHLAAAKRLLEGARSATLNLGGGQGASVREVITAAETIAGVRIPVIEAARRPGDPPSLVACCDRAREFLDWSPRRSDLQTILKDAWAWHQKRFGSADVVRSSRS